MARNLEKSIERAKELLATARHASMATVNEDGSPHNTPFRFLYDPELQFVYWGSHPESVHSKNVLRTGKIFVVLYDAIQRGGLYMKCDDAHILDGAELKKALMVHNTARIKEGSEPLTIDYYTGDSHQRMWRASITNFWVNGSKRDEAGNLIIDSRIEIEAKDLIDP